MTTPGPFERHGPLTRRGLLRAGGLGLTGAGAALLFGCGGDDGPKALKLDGPLETRRIRLAADFGLCFAPQLVARGFLLAEGFTEVEYFEGGGEYGKDVGAGNVDITQNWAPDVTIRLDEGTALVVLAGMHVGCYEFIGRDGLDAIQDLAGKTVATIGDQVYDGDRQFLASIMQFVGLRPDFELVALPADEAVRGLANGKIDAIFAPPPLTHQLHRMNAGHVILDSLADRPWSQYFCCMIIANTQFAKQNPVATFRALRAIFAGADLCAREPELAARYLVDNQFGDSYDDALATMKSIDYSSWPSRSPEDTLRQYSLRLNELGIIKSRPDEIIRRGTDWRFLEELKRQRPVGFRPAIGGVGGFALDCHIEGTGSAGAAAAPAPSHGS